MPRRLALALFACLSVLGVPRSGHAALGGNAADIASEAAASRMQLRAVDSTPGSYRMYELQGGAARTQVRQYARADGKVFGVAWSGAVKPDLRQVLGAYFMRYIDAVRAARRPRGVRRIVTPDFVIVLSGHMRHFTGAAWLPGSMPGDVNPADIR
jgi:hypothetical protein